MTELERYRKDLVLQASYAYERARPWNNKWTEIKLRHKLPDRVHDQTQLS